MEKNLNAFIPNCLMWGGERTVPISFKQIIISQCTRFNDYIKEKLERSIEEYFKNKIAFIIVIVDYDYNKGKFNIMISYQREEEEIEEIEEIEEQSLDFFGATKIFVGEATMFNRLDEILEDIKEILIKLIEKKIEIGTNELSQKEIDKVYIKAMANKPYIYEMEYIN